MNAGLPAYDRNADFDPGSLSDRGNNKLRTLDWEFFCEFF
jgi:hypothetical protein